MLEMQEDLNLYINTDWKKVRTISQLEMAIMDELSEYMRSGRRWKWWKGSGSPNEWNEKLEVIDVVHFYLSKILLHPRLKEMETGFLLGFETKQEFRAPIVKEDNTFDHDVFMRAARILMDGQPGVPANLDRFLKICGLTNLEVSAIYMAKITLNQIRQDQGYQKGTYTKVVGGLEDNDRLCDIVAAFLSDPGMTLEDVKLSVRETFGA